MKKPLFMGVVIISMLFGGTALAQIQANRLCIHNGPEYYANGPYYGYPNHAASKYFPNFVHWASTPVDKGGTYIYPWKVVGWSWGGMKATIHSAIWYWETCLQQSKDNPYSSNMTYDYPSLFCYGTVPHTGFPHPTYGSLIPNSVPVVGGNRYQYPSSMGGFNAYLNIFAVGAGSWVIPSSQPFYGYEFGFIAPCASALTVPSSYVSIVETVFMMKGPHPQYVTMSGDESDCLGGPGNKGRNYSIVNDTDNGYYWAWLNGCDGVDDEWAMCLFVCDTVTIPVNVPGDADANNPFSAYGFDVGVATRGAPGAHTLP